MMKRKPKNYILIPDSVAQQLKDHEYLVDELLTFFSFINEIDFEELSRMENISETLEKLREEFSVISQTYGKLRQEYGVVNFQGNELFTRNTVTGIKLGLMMGKLERAKSIWGPQLSLDYDAAKNLILHFTDRYLFKKEIEE